jgi:hypothetical protein
LEGGQHVSHGHAPSVVQELQPGLVDAVVVLRRQRMVFIAVRLEAVPGHWELIELLYRPQPRQVTDRWGEPRIASPVIHSPRPEASRLPVPATRVPAMASGLQLPPTAASSRVQRLVGRAMTFAVEEYDDDRAVARLAHHDQAALDQACDLCLSYTDIDLGIRGRTIGQLARVLYGDLPA